jgi:hypothetical protein
MSKLARLSLTIASAAALFCLTGTPPANGQAKKKGGAGRRTPVPDDHTGFASIFDGKTLKDWDGDTAFWRVEDSAIVGETTPEKTLQRNTFLVWRGGTTGDFELKLEYRISEAGNSGVQYRSAALPEAGPFVLKGYQADIDGRNNYTGMLYEERARGFLAERGQFVRVAGGGTRKMIGSPGDANELKALIRTGGWNQIHIVARGNVITHVINGRVMSLCIDEDTEGRSAGGLLGLQLHMGPPMKVEFRNVMLRGL